MNERFLLNSHDPGRRDEMALRDELGLRDGATQVLVEGGHLRHMSRWLGFAISIALVTAACDGTATAIPDSDAGMERLRRLNPLLPSSDPATAFPLSEAEVALLMDVESCTPCHEGVVRSWKQSAHAYASFDNPWYRAGVDAFRQAQGNAASTFCGGCHDPILMAADAMREPVQPNDPRASAGIPCLVCHSTSRTSPEGNGLYGLEVDDPLIPDPNDDAAVAAHVERLNPDSLRSSALCGSCHRSSLGETMGNPHHLPGIDDIGQWRRSVFAQSHAARLDLPIDNAPPIEPATCQSCHMQPIRAEEDFAAEAGHVASHQVPGAHTALAAQVGGLATSRARLQRSASIDIAAITTNAGHALPAETSELQDRVTIDVVIRNLETGHRFPGGTRDLQDTWLEVVIRDRRGRLASAGIDHHRQPDPTAFRLRSVPVDEAGQPDETHLVHRFRSFAFDRTIAPRDAQVVRYEATLPRTPVGRVTLTARLLHRRHPLPMSDLACGAVRSPRGEAFSRAVETAGRVAIDACQPEPITVVAETTLALGQSADGRSADRPLWPRLYDYALGWSHQTQDRLDEATPILNRALTEARTSAEQAMTMDVAAMIAARQGRVNEALQLTNRIQALVGDHASIHHRRGQANAQVWRWANAANDFRMSVALAPEDSGVWREYAAALGSSNRFLRSLKAARHGLRFAPRDEGLLRSQALALRELNGPQSSAAYEAFLLHRRVDEQPEMLHRCQAEVENCNRDRQPVPVVQLRTVR